MTKIFKATIIDIIVAFLITIITIGGIYLSLGQEIENAVQLINLVAIKKESKGIIEPIKIDTEKKLLDKYPAYGTKYATIEIPKINKTLPVYVGDSLDVLKNGVGHSTGSYFPGEGGSIVYMGHNTKDQFHEFSELEIGDKIKITTDYGEFNYTIYDMQVIKETEFDKIPIQREEEKLMIYTCYPFTALGHTIYRYVVYANLDI